MPPSSRSRRHRSLVDDDESSKSYADEATINSGDAKSVEEDNSNDSFRKPRKPLFRKRNILLFLAVTSVILLIVLGIFAVTVVYLSQKIDDLDVDFDLTDACEDIFGKSDNHLAAQINAMEAYKELNETKTLLNTKGPYDIRSLLTFKHPDLVLSGGDVGLNQYLPKNIYPSHYDVKLRVQLPVNGNNDFKITGEVRIEFDVKETSKRVYFNALGIDIVNAEDWSHRRLQVAKGNHSQVRYVEVPEIMEVGKKYHIILDFISQFHPGMEGLYLSRYLDTNGQVRYAASTQFESMNARRLFPCLDEPYYRSSFTFVVEHPPSYDAYSNMPNVSRTLIEDGQFAQTTFAPLPNSPTYILALLIADDYAVRSAKTKNGTEIRILARKEFIGDTKAYLDFAVNALEWFNEKFQISFPLPKIDIAGIYSFEAGAMENYGLTTYRETLLFDNTKYNYQGNLEGKVVIAHEFLHQWFGNLVTPEDWSQTFMSEGFAQFFETYAFLAITSKDEHLYSSYKAVENILVFLNDAKPVHPNDFVFDSGVELRNSFDMVTYHRAAAVFNMIRGMVGDDIFFDALRSYLSANKNGHAHWRKLAHALQNVIPKDNELSKIDFEAFFKAWFTVPGFPIVNVKKEGKKFTLKASLFLKLSDPIMDRRWPLGQTWPIPIWYRLSSDFSQVKFVMMEPGKDLVIEVPNDDDLIYVNSENHGYYIVNYEGHLFDKVFNATLDNFGPDLTDVSLRFQADACPLFLTGAISPRTYFKMQSTLLWATKLERDVFTTCLEFVDVKDTEIDTIFSQNIIDILFLVNGMKMQYRISEKATNFYLEEARQFKIQQFVDKLSCKLNQTLCTAKQNHNFEKYVMGCRPTDQTADCVSSEVFPSERALMYCEGIKTENRTYYEHLVQLFVNSRNPFETQNLIKGLVCAKDSQILSKLFTLITTRNDYINKGDRVDYFSWLHEKHPELTRKLFIENMNQILDTFPSSARDFLSTVFVSKTETDYLEVVQLLHNNRSLLNRFAHVFRDILNDSRAEMEMQRKVVPNIIQYFKELHETKVVTMTGNPELCTHFGSC